MLPVHATTARLVLPRQLLLKAGHHHSGMYAHSGKYALIDGRWKKLHHDKPAPKGAPISHAPGAAGQHGPVVLPDDHIAQLKYPAEKAAANPEMAAFNDKHLPKLLAHGAAGDATAILGSGFGTNSHSKKQVLIANHLLAQMGSKHQVALGQAAGSHAAVQAPAEAAAPAPQEPAPAPEAKAPAPEPVAPPPEPAPAPAVASPSALTVGEIPKTDLISMSAQANVEEANGLALAGNIKGLQGFISDFDTAGNETYKPLVHAKQLMALMRAKTAPTPAAAGDLAIPPFTDGKFAKSADYYKKVAQKVIDHAKAGNVAVLEDMKAQGLKVGVNGKVPKTWSGQSANSKMLLELHEQAMAHAGGGKAAEAAPATGKPTGTIKEYPGKDGTTVSIGHGANGSFAVAVKDNESGEFFPGAKSYPTMAWAESAAMNVAAGKPAGPEPKEGDTKPAADGGTLVLKDGHWVKQDVASPAAPVGQVDGPFKGTPHGAKMEAKTVAELQDIVGNPSYNQPAQDHAAATLKAKGAPADSPLTATQLENLQAIPWYKLKLPDSNSNAASVNKKLAALEAAAFAGDVAGIEAMSWGKNTYNKKLELVAQTALAALKEGAAPVAAAAPEAPGASQAKPAPAAAEPAAPAEADAASAIAANIKQLADAAGKAGYGIFQHPSKGDMLGDKKGNLKTFANLSQASDAAAKALAAGLDVEVGSSHPYLVQVHGLLPAPESAPEASPLPTFNSLKAAEAGMPPAIPKMADFNHVQVAQAWKHLAQTGKTDKLIASLSKLADSAVNDQAVKNHPDTMALAKYGTTLMQWLNAKNGVAQPPGPKEGDTKQGADGMLVLKDGHWVKQGEPAAAAPPAPAAPTHKKLTPKEAISIGKGLSTAPGNKAKLKAWAVAGNADALQNFIDTTGAHQPASKKYAQNLLAAMLEPDTGPAPKAPKAAPPAAPASAIPSMDDWTQIGPQAGSNPGGKYQDAQGQTWYCKFPQDADTAKSEVLAAKLYGLAGLAGQDAQLVTKGGKVGIASKWTTVTKVGPAQLAATPGALDGFAVDAWLGNWDVVGLGYDNLQVGADGKAVRVDAGGSLEYRAQGAKKPFGSKVTEMQSLVDAKLNPQSAAVFGKMTEADILASVAKVLAISDVAIRAMVNQFGPGDAAAKVKLADTLIARKKDLAAQYPAAAKAKKKHVFHPDKVSAPPNFLSWGTTGKGGPSSKQFLNEANETAVQAIFAAAKTGDVKAIQDLEAPTFNKDTGQVTGSAKVLEHPSQHVKGYAQQAINEINYQLNPPKRFRFDGGHPLHALNAAYPAHKGAASSKTAQNLGKFLILGDPGKVKLEDAGLPDKIKHAEGGGTLSRQTYKKQSHEAWAKLPKTQRDAIKSYTGPGYTSMNTSLWSGNPSGAAKAAEEAIHTVGYEIAPGTVLSRHIDESKFAPGELAKLLASTGSVLEEPAIMSTSIRPSSWVKPIQFKLHIGPGVKGLWVGPGSQPDGNAISVNQGEDEMLLPPNTRLLILSVRSGGADEDGFGAQGQKHVIEAIVLPTN